MNLVDTPSALVVPTTMGHNTSLFNKDVKFMDISQRFFREINSNAMRRDAADRKRIEEATKAANNLLNDSEAKKSKISDSNYNTNSLKPKLKFRQPLTVVPTWCFERNAQNQVALRRCRGEGHRYVDSSESRFIPNSARSSYTTVSVNGQVKEI